MSKSYRPKDPFDVAMKLLIPTETKVKGVVKKTFPDPESVTDVFFGSFKTYGGTENFSNDVYTIFDTAIIETWFDPNIKADCQIYICETGESYQIISKPENINMRHQFLKIKVEKIGGKP
jgi:hypothetical protein